MASDLLILAVLAKTFWDLAKSYLIPEGLFLFGATSLAFLLGLSDRMSQKILKEGLSIVVLIIFAASLQSQGLLPVYVAFFVVLTFVYFYGRIARLTGWVFIAVITLLLVVYAVYRYR